MASEVVRRNLIRMLFPEGILAPRRWLLKNKIPRHAIDNLIKSGQLESVAPGVYTKPPTDLTWQSIVCSLQTKFELDLVVGGLTALELQGFGHYLPLSNQVQIHLYGYAKLPAWTNSVIEGIQFIYHSNKELIGKGNNSLQEKNLSRFINMHPWRDNRPSLIVSCPERAILEVLTKVPDGVTFEHANQLMQSMTTLSPFKMQVLLEISHNIKVRRLFLWLAEHQNYAWLKKLDLSKIDLGSGNRVLVKGGKLDKKYMITVPESL